MGADGVNPVAAILVGVGELGPTIDVETAARLLGIGRTTAYQLAAENRLPVPVIRVGRSLRVPTVPLLALLGLTAPGAPAPAVGAVGGGAAGHGVARDEGPS